MDLTTIKVRYRQNASYIMGYFGGLSSLLKLSVNIKDQQLRELISAMEDPSAIFKSAGVSVARTLKRHYRAKNESEPNRLGGDRTNFWGDIGRSVRGPHRKGIKFVVSITDRRINQKVYGGRIVAKTTTYLAIPMHPDAHGIRARVFSTEKGVELFPVASKGRLFLAAEYQGKFQVFYALKREVNQDPWPNSIPSPAELTEAAQEGAKEELVRVLTQN